MLLTYSFPRGKRTLTLWQVSPGPWAALLSLLCLGGASPVNVLQGPSWTTRRCVFARTLCQTLRNATPIVSAPLREGGGLEVSWPFPDFPGQGHPHCSNSMNLSSCRCPMAPFRLAPQGCSDGQLGLGSARRPPEPPRQGKLFWEVRWPLVFARLCAPCRGLLQGL